MPATEANFDGLVGPTHNYAGLSYGNVASTSHGGSTASPKAAAREGLAKMKALADLGLVQGILPPHERPDVALLRRLGLDGPDDAAVLHAAASLDPTLLAIASSASAMWTANAATVAPRADTLDQRLHLVPANLVEKAHRAVEAETTRRVLERVFPHAEVHRPLPASNAFGDEGAANHTRFAADVGAPGRHLFVYGRRGLGAAPAPSRYPARQTLEASEAVARLAHLPRERCLFVQQHPDAIDRGVFHNDVIAVGHERWLFRHQDAFAADAEPALATLRAEIPGFTEVVVDRDAVGIDDAVRSYLFNSQLVRPPGHDAPMLIAPAECHEVDPVRRWLEQHVGPGAPIASVRFFDLRQSMQNGGGPACLRLRVVLDEAERAATNPRCLLDDALYDALLAWVDTHYRDRLTVDDLRDPQLLDESRAALDALTQLLDLGDLYPFQRA